MKVRQRSFFDEESRMEKISKIGDPLEMLNKVINWEMFRDILKKAVFRKENTRKGGHPSYDVVMHAGQKRIMKHILDTRIM